MKPPRYLAVMDRLNPLVVGLLHTPGLHHLASPGLMTVTLAGRKSGRRLRFPVGYHDQGDAVVVLVSNARNRRWWRNFRQPWPAELRLRGRTRRVLGEVLQPGSDEYRTRVGRSFRRAAFIPRMFDIDFDRRQGLTAEQMRALGDYAAVVRFQDAPD
ncbi:MAG: nitroreductase/quinone reductase family protein [Proteobacteria bacterium]|nr:nitroreductase/quinone reductase family protein [Pseudomonadota bacterium]